MKTTNKAIIWILVVFVVGILFGATASYLGFGPDEKDRRRGPRRTPEQIVERIAERLELDEDQKERLTRVLVESRDRHRQSYRAVEEETRAKIRQILRPDQLKRYEEMREESRRRHRRNESDRPRPSQGTTSEEQR